MSSVILAWLWHTYTLDHRTVSPFELPQPVAPPLVVIIAKVPSKS